MLTYVILGASYGFAAAVQPGQLQAYLVSQAVTNGWRRTVPAALAPLVSDAPVVAFVLLVLTRLSPSFLHAIQAIGGLFLLYLARGAFRSFREYQQAVAAPAPAHVTFFRAVLVNLLNPNPYLAWTLILGPLLLDAWREAPASGLALLVAFYVTLVLATAAIVILLAAARSLGTRTARAVLGVSAVALGAFGLFQLWNGVSALRGVAGRL